jgi:hypothetical protein
MPNSFFTRRAVSGGSTETFGPYSDLSDAMNKGCELLRTHGPTAVVSIDDGTRTIRGLHIFKSIAREISV